MSIVSQEDLNAVETRMKNRQQDFEDRLEKKQSDYEARCEADRKELRGEQVGMKATLAVIESKTDEGNSMVRPVAKAFEGLLSQPKVQGALISLVGAMVTVLLALAAYAEHRIEEMTQKSVQVQTQPQPIIVIPPTAFDGGAPSITLQAH